MGVNQIIGQNIRQQRKIRGLNQLQVAEYLGISYQQLQKYETGVNGISCAKILQLIEFLQCSFDDLCAGARDASALTEPQSVIDIYRTAFLIDHFQRINSHNLRDKICNLLQAITQAKTVDGESQW